MTLSLRIFYSYFEFSPCLTLPLFIVHCTYLHVALLASKLSLGSAWDSPKASIKMIRANTHLAICSLQLLLNVHITFVTLWTQAEWDDILIIILRDIKSYFVSADMTDMIKIPYCPDFFFVRIVGVGVQTGSTRHVGHWMAYCICTGWLWWWTIWWNEDWQGKPKYSEKTCPIATLSTTNPTWPDPGSNPGNRGGKPATNRLSYGSTIPPGLLQLCVSSVDGTHSAQLHLEEWNQKWSPLRSARKWLYEQEKTPNEGKRHCIMELLFSVSSVIFCLTEE
jgi:hypothetical protein